MPSRNRRRLTIVGIVVGVILLGVVGGPFIYIHFFAGSTPAKLPINRGSSSGTSTTAGSQTQPLAGAWKISTGSQAGYRVNEVLLGQTTTAVGRTSAVTGHLQITGTAVDSGSFTVDLTKVHSNKSQRDGQFQGPIMDTARFPDATFELTQPIQLGTPPGNGQVINVTATGRLTLRGQTRPVTVSLTGRRSGNTIAVSGSIPVTFSDYGIPNPSQSFVTTEDHGVIEFLLLFDHG